MSSKYKHHIQHLSEADNQDFSNWFNQNYQRKPQQTTTRFINGKELGSKAWNATKNGIKNAGAPINKVSNAINGAQSNKWVNLAKGVGNFAMNAWNGLPQVPTINSTSASDDTPWYLKQDTTDETNTQKTQPTTTTTAPVNNDNTREAPVQTNTREVPVQSSTRQAPMRTDTQVPVQGDRTVSVKPDQAAPVGTSRVAPTSTSTSVPVQGAKTAPTSSESSPSEKNASNPPVKESLKKDFFDIFNKINEVKNYTEKYN